MGLWKKLRCSLLGIGCEWHVELCWFPYFIMKTKITPDLRATSSGPSERLTDARASVRYRGYAKGWACCGRFLVRVATCISGDLYLQPVLRKMGNVPSVPVFPPFWGGACGIEPTTDLDFN